MSVKPLNWISWHKARCRMPEIWDGWHFQLTHADKAMVNSLRRGYVPYRGKAWTLGSRYTRQPIALRDVVAGLLTVRNATFVEVADPMFLEVADYEATEWGSVLALGGYQSQPMTVNKTAQLDDVELGWDEFRDHLVRFELPASVTPKAALRRRRPGPKDGEQSIKDIACKIALQILGDDEQRRPLGYGRRIALARLVNVELAGRGHQYEEDSIRKMIAPTVRQWEDEHPRK
jgi:hypothetical protein